MKYAVILYDGMADYPIEELGGKTPMEAARKPVLDALARRGEVGLIQTVAEGMKPGSDIANLSVMGYDPKKYYTGRSPLEAMSIGVDMLDTDIALRCNLVTLSDAENYSDKAMLDYSGGDISTQEAGELIEAVQAHFGNDIYAFYRGVAYRHCLIWHNGTTALGAMTPPHDISGKVIGSYLSDCPEAADLIRMMRESYSFLKEHPVNKARMSAGKQPANSIWLWGEGKKPALPSFEKTFGVKGSVISAVDLLKGIGKCAGMNTPDVEGATGYIDTNFAGKAKAAVDELNSGRDFVYVHFEAPDECGHRREIQNKIRSVELIDELVLPVILEGLEQFDDYKVLVLPDHPTPIATATHASDAVPYMIYHKMNEKNSGVNSLHEKSAKQTGNFIDFGPDIMKKFLSEK